MEDKAALVRELMQVKEQSNKTWSEIASETGLTNVYAAQLFRRQAQLKPETVDSLRKAVPGLSDDHIRAMMRPPFRSYDPSLMQEPALYRLQEAVMHFGESIKEVINEDFGDGINQNFCLQENNARRLVYWAS
eukprot:TRINITY_DN2235_c0_g1_i3.p1 TRINITY_DN2235_c0_g1~~TRINITY_DN2235_c0_g1_i3.p1  ORF type:complete len:133 (+),score=28.38 TRINITY_DN2235_c0_g1_i3:328-726(+)